MCVIYYSKEGKMIEPKMVSDCWLSNPDGAGVISRQNNKLSVVKGIMDVKQLQEYLDSLGEVEELMVHFRIGTSGGKTSKATHPFACGEGGLLAHNGILGKYTFGEYSDTKNFADRVKLVRYKDRPEWIKGETDDPIVIMYNDKPTQLNGRWVEREGYMLSNTHFEWNFNNYKDYKYRDDWEDRYEWEYQSVGEWLYWQDREYYEMILEDIDMALTSNKTVCRQTRELTQEDFDELKSKEVESLYDKQIAKDKQIEKDKSIDLSNAANVQ